MANGFGVSFFKKAWDLTKEDELSTYMALEKMALLIWSFFLTCMALKRTFIPSMSFRPFFSLDGVKSRVKRSFCPWRKKIYRVLFVCCIFRVILSK